MPISQNFVGVFIRRSDIAIHYTGGIGQFVLDLPNQSLLDDGEVFGVSFMSGADLNRYLDELLAKSGLLLNVGDQRGECCATLMQFALDRPDWIERVNVVHPDFNIPWPAWRLKSGISRVFAYAGANGKSAVPFVTAKAPVESQLS